MENRWKRILVPTDFSAEGNRAVPVAFELARRHEAELLLVHVLVLPSEPSPLYALPSPDMLSDMEGRARAQLEELVPRARGAPSHEVVVLRGPAAEEICKLASAREVSLIALSSHGRTGLARFLLGSVTERVVRHAPCSVLVVRP